MEITKRNCKRVIGQCNLISFIHKEYRAFNPSPERRNEHTYNMWTYQERAGVNRRFKKYLKQLNMGLSYLQEKTHLRVNMVIWNRIVKYDHHWLRVHIYKDRDSIECKGMDKILKFHEQYGSRSEVPEIITSIPTGINPGLDEHVCCPVPKLGLNGELLGFDVCSVCGLVF